MPEPNTIIQPLAPWSIPVKPKPSAGPTSIAQYGNSGSQIRVSTPTVQDDRQEQDDMRILGGRFAGTLHFAPAEQLRSDGMVIFAPESWLRRGHGARPHWKHSTSWLRLQDADRMLLSRAQSVSPWSRSHGASTRGLWRRGTATLPRACLEASSADTAMDGALIKSQPA